MKHLLLLFLILSTIHFKSFSQTIDSSFVPRNFKDWKKEHRSLKLFMQDRVRSLKKNNNNTLKEDYDNLATKVNAIYTQFAEDIRKGHLFIIGKGGVTNYQNLFDPLWQPISQFKSQSNKLLKIEPGDGGATVIIIIGLGTWLLNEATEANAGSVEALKWKLWDEIK